MSDPEKKWDGEMVRTWLENRFSASRNEQARADKRGRESEDDYDKAAAEEWVCRATKGSEATNDQKRFADLLKTLLDRDEFDRVSVHDDRRFEREVRSCLRKLIRMTKANTGFENMSRYQ
ncbi:MAG: hypothetical protein WC729_05600 [Sphingomonas sp.]|jgi:hypothetical protein|uniref:hypothetical protein n=1 Tax=Sphingomonas sp. TaxID=28214 RepID=UPI003569B980